MSNPRSASSDMIRRSGNRTSAGVGILDATVSAMTNPAVASQLESGASTGCYADYGKGGLSYLVLAIWLLIPREDIGAKSRTTAVLARPIRTNLTGKITIIRSACSQ